MATIKANKDKARFISNPISQDALDTDWVDHEVITKYKLPEIIVDASTTTTSLESPDVITTGDKLKVYNATDGIVERTAGTVTASAGLVSSTNPFGDGSLLNKLELEDNLTGTIGSGATSTGTIGYSSGVFGRGLSLSASGSIVTSTAAVKSISMQFKATLDRPAEQDYILDGREVSGTGYLYLLSDRTFSFAGLSAFKIDNVDVASGAFVAKIGVWYHLYVEFTTAETSIKYGARITDLFKSYSDIDMIEEYNRVLLSSEILSLKTQNIIYSAPITATTNIPTKAYFNKTIDTTLSAEATGKCKSSTVTQIGVL